MPLPLLVVVLVLLAAAAAGEPRLPVAEQEAVYAILEAVDAATPWRARFPDDLCLAGPHGVACDLFPREAAAAELHVVELSLGYVSDFSANPACTAPSAVAAGELLTGGLAGGDALPRLRKLFVYGCFASPETTLPLPPLPWRLPPTLEELVLVKNPALSGSLAISGDRLPLLRRLVITGSNFSGELPATSFPSLEHLALAGNQFAGRIPSALVTAPRTIKILDLSANRLSGDVPAELGDLQELLKLDLSANRLTGAIPGALGALGRLELLDLSKNRLTGGIPDALRGMSAIKELHLSGNRRLGGRIPEIFEAMGAVSAVGLSNLGLTGAIPASLGVSLQHVRFLGLDGNSLEGEVPPEMARLGSRVRLRGNRGLCVASELGDGARIAGVKLCNGTDVGDGGNGGSRG